MFICIIYLNQRRNALFIKIALIVDIILLVIFGQLIGIKLATTIGLILDMAGVIIIAWPHIKRPPVPLVIEERARNGERIIANIGQSMNPVELNKHYHTNRWGLFFLLLGFCFQIIGEII